jgi:hypothetical protein
MTKREESETMEENGKKNSVKERKIRQKER